MAFDLAEPKVMPVDLRVGAVLRIRTFLPDPEILPPNPVPDLDLALLVF
jgi:hypothetical protein